MCIRFFLQNICSIVVYLKIVGPCQRGTKAGKFLKLSAMEGRKWSASDQWRTVEEIAPQWESEASDWRADCIMGLLSSWQLLPDNTISRRSLQNSQLMGLKWCDGCCWRWCWSRRWRRRPILLLVKIHTRERMTHFHFTDFTVSPALRLWDYSLHNLSSFSLNLL